MHFSTIAILSVLGLFLRSSLINAHSVANDTNATDTDTDFSDTDAIIAIKQTLALWSLVVDSKNFPLLSKVFTSDVVTSIAPVNDPVGLAEITAFYVAAFDNLTTFHEDSTNYVEFLSEENAKATHYVEAVYIGQGNLTGQILTYYESYVDFLRPDEEDTWKIYNRSLNIVVSVFCSFWLIARIVLEMKV